MSDETEMVAKMFDRVIAERDAARAQVAKLTQERNEARAERDKALARHGLFMVEGGPVVMATEYDALKDELSQARASIASYNAGKDNLLRTIAALRDEARAAAQAMSRPVSDEVWIKHSVMMSGLRVAGKDSVDALIAARVRDSKSAPARADEASK
jgi:hypothetical protein